MSPETAQWLLTGAHAFQKEPKLTSWNNLSKENFTSLLTSIFEVENFTEAVRLLEQVVAGDLTAPSLPPDLKLLLEEWQKSLAQKEEAHRVAREKVEKFLEEQRRLAVRKHPILPLAGPAKPGIIPQPPTERRSKKEAFPQEITERLATEDEGIAFTPLYTLLHPRVAISFVKKVAFSPVVKTLQIIDKIAGEELKGENVSEWREILHQGLTSEDIDTSIVALEQAGVSPEEPKIRELEGKRIKTKAYEQKHWVLSKILKHYHEFSKITGRRQIFLPSIKTFLPRLAPLPVWAKKQGYAWKLRQGLNQIGFALRLHEKVSLAPGKTIVHFSLPDKITRIFTFGRVKSFGVAKAFLWQKTGGAILFRLGKTAFGKGVKRASAWLLTKLGLKATMGTVAAAVAPETAGLSLLVYGAIEIIGKLLGKVQPTIKKATLFLLGTAFVAGGLILSFPANLLFFGTSAIFFGTAIFGPTFFSRVVASTSSLATQTAAAITQIFTAISLTTGTIGAVFIVGIILAFATTTFFIVITTAGAFILPVKPETTGSKGIEIGPMPTVAPNPSGVYLAEAIVYRLNVECRIDRVNTTTWSQAKKCLEESNLLNKQIIIRNFEISVFWTGTSSLQCVGFVAGVEEALGRNFPQDRNARDYLTSIPSGYQRINSQEVRIGDIAIWRGTTYGHMAIVVRRDGVGIVVAQAWGDDNGIDGRVNLTETTIDNPDGFIRPL